MAEQQNDDPKPVEKLMGPFLEKLADGALPPGTSEDASLRYEQDNNALLRKAASDPNISDEQSAELAKLIHEGDVAIRSLQEGEGHRP